MRTLVVSDLHLGARTGVDVLRRPAALEALVERVRGAGRLVLLGDVLELRHGPARDALAAAGPVLEAVGRALGDAEVVLVPGNHDYGLVGPWLERRGRSGPPPRLGLEERAGPGPSGASEAIAEMLRPARLDVAYPGVWLADGVYATHGHYLDRHLTVPSFERLAIGTLARVLDVPVEATRTPDDYELVLAPLYTMLEAVAARTADGRGAGHAGASGRTWRALSRDGSRRRPWRVRLLAGAVPLGVGLVNALGLGPVRGDLSGAELRRATLRGMRDVVAHLKIPARTVVFGHTHRPGPLPGDDPAGWTLPGGGRLVNCGSWVYEEAFLGDGGPASPYWPGGVVELDDEDGGAPPRHARLLAQVDAARLRR